MLTIWFGKATIRPANGPDSNVSRAAKPEPDAISSGGIACSETVRFASALGSVCCHAGITDVASSNEAASAGAPFLGEPAGPPWGQASRVALTSGAAVATGSASATTGSGSATTGSASATTGSGSATTGSASATTGSGSATTGSASATTGAISSAGSSSASGPPSSEGRSGRPSG